MLASLLWAMPADALIFAFVTSPSARVAVTVGDAVELSFVGVTVSPLAQTYEGVTFTVAMIILFSC
jgi:hypothetical protein